MGGAWGDDVEEDEEEGTVYRFSQVGVVSSKKR